MALTVSLLSHVPPPLDDLLHLAQTLTSLKIRMRRNDVMFRDDVAQHREATHSPAVLHAVAQDQPWQEARGRMLTIRAMIPKWVLFR